MALFSRLQSHHEARAPFGPRESAHIAAMFVSHAAANRQTDAGAGITRAPVQTRENIENRLSIRLVEADAVIFHFDGD